MLNEKKLILELCGYPKLSKEKQVIIDELIEKVISKQRSGSTDGAYSVINAMLGQLGLNTLDEAAQNEIREKFYELLSREAGFSIKDFIWNTKGAFYNPQNFNETIATGDSIQGPDDSRITSINRRVLSTDGLFRNRPEKKKQDKDEMDISDKLEKLKKLFQNRNQKDVSIDDIRKILTSESKEQQFSALQYLNEAKTMLDDTNDCGTNEQQIMDFYFSEDSPITSTFSANAWSSFKYVYLSKDNIVTATNSFFVKVGNLISKERIIELQNVGIKIYFNESLTEAFQSNDDILDGITYEELVSIVLTYHDDPDESAIMREYDKLLSKKMKNAKFEMRKAAKQMIKDIQND